jgi:hypothetical protein
LTAEVVSAAFDTFWGRIAKLSFMIKVWISSTGVGHLIQYSPIWNGRVLSLILPVFFATVCLMSRCHSEHYEVLFIQAVKYFHDG